MAARADRSASFGVDCGYALTRGLTPYRGPRSFTGSNSSFGTSFLGGSFGASLGASFGGCAAIRTAEPKSTRAADAPEIWSGVFDGKTDGTPIGISFRNSDQRSGDYGDIKDKYRPGHADFTFDAKYGFRDYRGGGRSSARETVCRVAAGAVAKKLLAQQGVRVLGYVKQIGDIVAAIADPSAVTLEQVEATPVRCPEPD